MDRKPLKSKRLKIMSYINSFYATFDGDKIWEMDRSAVEILKLCDGKRSVDEIAEEIARKIDMKKEEVKPTLEDILAEFEKVGFIEYVSS